MKHGGRTVHYAERVGHAVYHTEHVGHTAYHTASSIYGLLFSKYRVYQLLGRGQIQGLALHPQCNSRAKFNGTEHQIWQALCAGFSTLAASCGHLHFAKICAVFLHVGHISVQLYGAVSKQFSFKRLFQLTGISSTECFQDCMNKVRAKNRTWLYKTSI
jgi:hypothetical protein